LSVERLLSLPAVVGESFRSWAFSSKSRTWLTHVLLIGLSIHLARLLPARFTSFQW